jgi:hypothetical protein
MKDGKPGSLPPSKYSVEIGGVRTQEPQLRDSGRHWAKRLQKSQPDCGNTTHRSVAHYHLRGDVLGRLTSQCN